MKTHNIPKPSACPEPTLAPEPSLNPEPFCREAPLSAGHELHEDYLEWARLRAGATDFLGEWFQAPLGSGIDTCPACQGTHAGDPATYFWQCPALEGPRAFWLSSIPAGGSVPADGSTFLQELLRGPANPADPPRTLRFIGHGMRLRRKSPTARAPPGAGDWVEGVDEEDALEGPDDVSGEEDDEDDL